MGILTHTCTKGERCKITKRINLSLETKIYSPSSVLAPFCPGKHTETLKIHLLVISRKSELHKNQTKNYPKWRQPLFTCRERRSCPFTSPNAGGGPTLQHLTTLQETVPGAGHPAAAAEDGHTGDADAHPARGDMAGRDSRTSLAPGPTAAQPTSSILIVFAACFHSAWIWHFSPTESSFQEVWDKHLGSPVLL